MIYFVFTPPLSFKGRRWRRDSEDKRGGEGVWVKKKHVITM
jgi:hypothetical protein